jgi:glycosyltransferase involved in cell wall biosynthesis
LNAYGTDSAREPVRILIAVDRLGYGDDRFHGAGRLLVEWSQALHERGVDVTTVVLRSARAFKTPPGHEILYLNRGMYDPRTIGDFRRLLRERRIQVAHLQGFGSLAFGRLAARSLRIPVVATIHADHTFEPRGYPWFVKLADRLFAPLTARCIAVSEATARFARSYQGFKESQIEVWHNPVDLSRFRPPSQDERVAVRKSLGVPPDTLLVVAVARLDPVKGVDILVEAWPSVVRQVASARLLVVGEGRQRDELVSALSSQGALDSVQFLGYRSDVPDILHAADLIVLPSRSEGLPLAALEGLASGLPVVAHAVGGVPELIVDGDNGRLIPPHPEALAAALTEVLSDRTLRARLALRARPSVEKLSLRDYAERLEQMYRQTADPTVG